MPAVVRLLGSRVDIVLVIVKSVFTLMSRHLGLVAWVMVSGFVFVLFLGFCFLPGIYESVLTMFCLVGNFCGPVSLACSDCVFPENVC